MAGGLPVRHEALRPTEPARDGWLERFQARRIARRLVAALRRDVPGLVVDERPTIVDGAWTLGVTLPEDVDARRFLAGTVAECVPWRPDGGSRSVRAAFAPGYSDEEQDQLVLVAAKVLYYLQADEPEPQDTGAATSSSAEAAADPA